MENIINPSQLLLKLNEYKALSPHAKQLVKPYYSVEVSPRRITEVITRFYRINTIKHKEIVFTTLKTYLYGKEDSNAYNILDFETLTNDFSEMIFKNA